VPVELAVAVAATSARLVIVAFVLPSAWPSP
jgi:hypothetical protein